MAFTAHAGCLLFPGSDPNVSRTTVPRALRLGFILPWRSSSSEFLRSKLPPTQRRRTYPGFVPHRGITGVHPLSRRMPSLRFVPSSGFLNLSTVSSAHRLCRLVSSRSHVQGSTRSGASLSAQPCSLAKAVAPVLLCLEAVLSPLLQSPQLRGFDPCGAALPIGPGSAVPSLAPLFGFSPPGLQPPLVLRLPRAIRSRRFLIGRPQRISAAG